MIQIKQFTFNHFGVNCYVLADRASKECAIVDPSAEASYEDAQLAQYLEANGLSPKMVLLTHAHVDHVAGLREACERFKLPVSFHPDGAKYLRQADAYGNVMGFEVGRLDDLDQAPLADGQKLLLGESEIECRLCPGHCPGSLCYVLKEEKAVLTGDALFRLSIGRTDLPGGDYNTLIDCLKRRILSLDEDFEVLPGHGEHSTIGEELRYNSFLN